MTFSHLSGNFWIPSQKNCAGLAAKNESSQFLISCSDVNRIPVRAYRIDGNKLVSGRIFRPFFGNCSLQKD